MSQTLTGVARNFQCLAGPGDRKRYVKTRCLESNSAATRLSSLTYHVLDIIILWYHRNCFSLPELKGLQSGFVKINSGGWKKICSPEPRVRLWGLGLRARRKGELSDRGAHVTKCPQVSKWTKRSSVGVESVLIGGGYPAKHSLGSSVA